MQSRLVPIKDHITLIKALSIVKNSLKTEIKLRLAGDGETLPLFKELVLRLNVGENVEFCGMLNEKELAAFTSSLDIYIHATHGETLSTALMQAQAFGLPIHTLIQNFKLIFNYISTN